MIIPSYVTIYHRGKRLKTGSECPKELEKQLQKAIDATMEKARVQGERLAPYDGEEKVIDSCSQYPEYRLAVGKVYTEARKAAMPKEAVAEEKQKKK